MDSTEKADTLLLPLGITRLGIFLHNSGEMLTLLVRHFSIIQAQQFPDHVNVLGLPQLPLHHGETLYQPTILVERLHLRWWKVGENYQQTFQDLQNLCCRESGSGEQVDKSREH